MISKTSQLSRTFVALYKAKENEDREYEDVEKWITDIIENPDRPRLNYCEICGHSGKKLEQHHVRGRKYGNECIMVCCECHKKLTDNQRLWNYNNPDNLLDRGLIDVCKLKYEKTGEEIYKLMAEKLTEGFIYD